MNIALGLVLAASPLAAQDTNDTAEAHVELARAASGGDFDRLLEFQRFRPGPSAARHVAGLTGPSPYVVGNEELVKRPARRAGVRDFPDRQT